MRLLVKAKFATVIQASGRNTLVSGEAGQVLEVDTAVGVELLNQVPDCVRVEAAEAHDSPEDAPGDEEPVKMAPGAGKKAKTRQVAAKPGVDG